MAHDTYETWARRYRHNMEKAYILTSINKDEMANLMRAKLTESVKQLDEAQWSQPSNSRALEIIWFKRLIHEITVEEYS